MTGPAVARKQLRGGGLTAARSGLPSARGTPDPAGTPQDRRIDVHTTAEPRAPAARTVTLAALSLALAGTDAAAQAPDTAPPRPGVAADQPAPDRDFWSRVRDEAQQLTALRAGPAGSALRYRISPQLAHAIHAAAEGAGLDPDLGYRLVRAESNFNPRARSRAGALGLTQLMPRTARWLEPSMTTTERILQPEANLAVGFRYLRQLIEKYDDLRLALLAYNRGEGAVDRDLRRGRNPENGYSRYVLGTGANRYSGDGRRGAGRATAVEDR
jgi:soluble lytic murein transglycosylase-like protein